jgi:hypothetical protein
LDRRLRPKLSHNLVPDLTSRPPADPAAAFSQLRTSLIKVLRNSPESREPICDALELIESLQQQAEAKRNPDPPETSRVTHGSDPVQQYVLQRTAEGEFLTERRANGSQPFRCPRATYDAAAGVLAAATEPMHFEDLLERLNGAMNERQADYRLRVCLRFWAARGLVERFRTRYRAADASTFLDEARRLWSELGTGETPVIR